MKFASMQQNKSLLLGHCVSLAVAALCGLMASKPADAAPTRLGWQPQRTWVFAVGLVQFKEKATFSSFPPENRRDEQLVEFFRRRGVPASNIIYLQDRGATLRKIQTSLRTFLQKTAPGDSLFFYYEGHGYRSEDKTKPDAFFAAYDTDGEKVAGWSVNSITTTIDRYFKGKRALLTADCCYSGYLAETVKRNRGPIAYASVTSSSARELSTGHWTFTDCLLDALRGETYVDLNGDGRVTLAEFATHAHDDMLLAEEQRSSFSLSGGFPRDMVLAFSSPKPKSPVGKRVKAKQNGVWYAARVVSTKSGRLEVKYIGYDEPTEWFDADDTSQVRWLKPQSKFAVGTRVEVLWQGDWYPAKVLKVDGPVHFIHYINDDSSWDEWVSSKRIRAPRR